jgi:hypothetical protein
MKQKMCRTWFCLSLLGAMALLGQSAEEIFRKAPPAVDAALRERIELFYKLHGEGKFRQAEDLVAEDTKEFFYNSNKPRYLSCEIQRIDYSENFTKARALVVAEMRVPMPGFMDKPVKVPHVSPWKLVDGQWYWWVDPEERKMTPFGKMDSAEPGAVKGPAPNPSAGPSVETIQNAVKADRSAIELKREADAAGNVHISNSLPGAVKLMAQPPPAGLSVSIDQAEVKGNSSATVSIRVTDPAKAPKQAVVNVLVEPIGKMIPIRVTTVSGS